MEQFRSTTIQNDEHANTRTSSSLMRELIWVAAICLFFKTSTAIAQIGDYATQPETVSGNGTTTMVSSDNYGHFVATNTTIDFVGNDGALISQIAGLSSSSNICVATDAYYENFLIATSSGTNISVYECSGYDFGNKCIRMADPNVVTGLVPPLITTQPIVSGSGTSVTRIVATIDYFGDMVIAWQTNTRRLGFMKLSEWGGFHILLTPFNVLDDLGNPAIGSIPSIAGPRNWVYGGNLAHIAFERDAAPLNQPVDFTTTVDDGTYGTATGLVLPPAANKTLWVSVAVMNDAVGTPFYFYGTTDAPASSNNCIWGTDGTSIDLTIYPRTFNLIFYPSTANPIPDVAVAETYNDLTKVYCDYNHLNDDAPTDGTTILTIITQTQLQNIHTFPADDPTSFPTLSTNQMGTWTFTTDGGTPVLFRKFDPIASDIVSNTLASGLVEIAGGPVIDLWTWDTLRTFGTSLTDYGTQSLYFASGGITLEAGKNPGDIYSTDPDDWGTPVGDLPEVIQFDYGTQVDFGNQPGIWIKASSDGFYHGIIEYYGPHFLNMNQDHLFAVGDISYMEPIGQPYPLDDAHMRGWINFHAPCTLTNGSGLDCIKARVNFDLAGTQAAMAELQTTGVNSYISIDSSHINLGATSLTSPLTQISMNSANLNAQNEFISVTNSWLGTQYPGITTPTGDDGGPYPGWGVPRSDIIAKKLDHANFTGNTIAYAYAEIRDPVTSVTYDNNSIWAAKNALKIDWNQIGSAYAGTIDASYDTVYEVWDIGSSSDPMLDFEIYGFDVPSLYSITAGNNIFSTYELNGIIWGITHDALYFSNSTNGNIGSNLIVRRHNIGIHTYEFKGTRSFLCSNSVDGSPCCGPINIGIQQDGNGTGYIKLNEVNQLGGATDSGIGYYATGGDKSYLIENAFDSCRIGAKIAGTSVTVLNGSHGGSDDYAAFNYFQNNGSEQIAVDGTAQPFFGPNPPGVSDPANWGQNKFVSNGGQLHFNALSPPITLTNLNNVSENDWTPGIATGTSTTDTKLSGITYDNATDVTMTNPGFYCGGGFGYKAKGKGTEFPQSPGCGSVQVPNPPDSLCLYYRAFAYDRIDPLKERDSMMAYCVQHPFATTGYGMWRSAMAYAMAGANDYWVQNIQQHDSAWSRNYWATMFDWYIKIQPMNPDTIYQDIVMSNMAGCASAFDLNLACNLEYNYSLRFPWDSTGVVDAWEGYRLLRRQQSEIPEDTTALTVLTFPLTPLQVAGIEGAAMPSASMFLNLFPNPAGKSVGLQYEIPSGEEASITIFDATGRDVKKLTALTGGMQHVDLDVESLITGHYFVRLASGGDVVTKELIVQH